MSDEKFWAETVEAKLANSSQKSLPPTLKLPALPHAVTKFLERSSDPNASLKELAAIVETDTGLTVELLRHVNSAFMGLRNKAKSAQQAIALLGMRQSKLFLINTGTKAAVQARKSKLINQSNFWSSNLQRALFAREVARILGTDLDVAFAGGLLQDFLLPVLTNEFTDEYLAFLDSNNQSAETLTTFEDRQFGWNHASTAANLARRWHLPDELVCCLLCHHAGLKILADPDLRKTPVAAVALSGMLPDQVNQDRSGLEMLFRLQEKWSAFNVVAIAERVDEQQEQLGLGVSNQFPLSRRCQPATATA
ncbi:HDOD domain-containing protein [Thalassoroseus pseudoceratinae]|uniref:HDOD domain-containing protein n=1 Tax=Thalassoroseus pseudoceratinae TaxID=2713176 RepID=UPI00141DED0F|nr:HDOD domain-containing protein [Thalassoroseus pseudoceratinae]